jgi:hypothetical protein
MRFPASVPLTAVLLALPVCPALAAPPGNDTPETAAQFEPYAAENGVPVEQQAIAELAEAQPDPGVPRCLGPSSFARTVWFWVPGTETPRELSLEASGRTLEVVDLAAFVQPPIADSLQTGRANACAGLGGGGSDIAPDSTSAVALRVPPFHAVFFQVGYRGTPRSAEDESVVLSLLETPLEVLSRPAGDEAGPNTPRIRRRGTSRVLLGAATTTPEDPAVPACPSLAGVWRRVRVRATRRWAATASGAEATGLSVFAGDAAGPNPDGFRACVDRAGAGALVLPVRARAGEWLWIRAGTDRPPPFAEARIGFRRARPREKESGGGCLASRRPRVGGGLVGAPSARMRNRLRSVTVGVSVRGGPVCAAVLELVGPRGLVYAHGTAAALRGRSETARLRRLRRLRRGRYRVRVQAAGLGGVRRSVPSSIRFRLR